MNKNITSSNERVKYGYLASGVSLICNIMLAVAKIVIGALFGSIAILADGLNNLTDGGNSLVSLIGFKISSLPADKKHPYGHARIEYVISLVISIIILVIGFQLIITSIEKIISPTKLEYSIVMVIMLVVSIFVKIGLGVFNRHISVKINSLSLKATAVDSFTDSLITTVVLIGTLVGMYLNIEVDSYFGIVVACFILYSGAMLIRETINPLIGEGLPEEELNKIVNEVKSYEGVMGVHDIQAHNYGPNRYFISLHVEVDSKVDIMVSHELVDKIETDLTNSDIKLLIHMDPIVIDDPILDSYKAEETLIIKQINKDCTLHDFRMVKGQNRINLIFDVCVPYLDKRKDSEIKDLIQLKTKEIDKKLFTVINIDRF